MKPDRPEKKEPRGLPSTIALTAGPALLIVSNIFLFGPFTIYSGNLEEFVLPLSTILGFYFLPALVLFLVLSVGTVFLPQESKRRYASVLLVLGLLIWLQGNLLVWKYGLLDGVGIDWTINSWRGYVDGVLWAALLALGLLYYKRIYKIAAFVSIFLFSAQLILLISMSLREPEIWKTEEKVSGLIHASPSEEIYGFSKTRNVIHFILDAFGSGIFQEIIDEEPEHYLTALEGFTFFKETTGSFPTTRVSIPAILSGKTYKNEIPINDFIRNTYKGKTINRVLYDEGYEVDLVSNFLGYFKKELDYSFFYRPPTPYGVTERGYGLVKSTLMVDLVLFRYAPHFLKKFVYNNQAWLVSRFYNKRKYRYFSHRALLQDLIDNASVNRAKPVYKLIHLMTTHSPFIVNKDCEFAGRVLKTNRENKKIQSKCSLDHFILFLKKLKSLGIYDSSLIILHADHGTAGKVEIKGLEDQADVDFIGYDAGLITDKKHFSRIVGTALPLMAIKPPKSRGTLRISSAQVMLTDIPDTISSILGLSEGFNGRSVFEVDPDEKRVREFRYYKWRHKNWQSDYFEHLYEFVINGSVFDTASWQLVRTYDSPNLAYSDDDMVKTFPAEGVSADIGSPDEGRLFLAGFSGREGKRGGSSYYRWAVGRHGRLTFRGLSLAEGHRMLVTFEVQPYKVNKDKEMVVQSKLSSAKIILKPGRHNYSVVLEFPAGEDPVLDIYYEDAASPKSLGASKDTRELAVKWHSIAMEYETQDSLVTGNDL